MSILNVQELSIKLSKDFSLGPISFELNPTDCLGIIGENGSGKSTLLNAFSGNYIFTGNFEYKHMEFRKTNSMERAKFIASIAQNPEAELDFTVEEAISLARTCHSNGLWESQEDKEAVNSVLQSCNLKELRNQKLTTLSGGQRQRVFLARALAQQSEILILDEPTNHLDVRHHNGLREILLDQTVKQNIIMIASHDINWLTKIATHFLILSQGKQIGFIKSNDLSQEVLTEAFHHPFRIIEAENEKLFLPN